jgi:membrane-bound lytic murein transglycosylase D
VTTARAARALLIAATLGALSGCVSFFPRAKPPTTAPPSTPSAPTAPEPGTPGAPSRRPTPAPASFDPRAGELAEAEKPEWMRTLARPDFAALPLRWSARVSKFLEQYKNDARYREIVRGWIRRLPAYRASMEAVLERHGLPRGLIFVAMIESGFSAGAISSKNAGGFWQFKPDVARGYGLEVNFWVDERRDPEKSTEAAALYLGDLHARFGSWELALAGYNAGFFAILTSIARYNSNDYLTLCQIESGLPFETTEYVPKVLAVSIVERNQAAFGLGDIVPDRPRRFDLVSVGGGVSFDAIASRLGVPSEEIALLNPAYPRKRTPPDRGPMSLRVPEGRARALTDLGPGGDYVLVKVRPGETLARIAKANRIARDRLRQINGVTDESDVTPGTALFIPRAKKPAAPAAKPAAPKAAPKPAPKAAANSAARRR